MQCTYNATQQRLRKALLQWKHNNTFCISEVRITVNNIKTMSAAQKCFYGEFMSPATIKRTYVFM